MFEIINRISPIILLLMLGKFFQIKQFISVGTVIEIKKLVVNVALPAVLFSSFFNMTLEAGYFLFVPIILTYCVLLYFVGLGLHKWLKVKGTYFPFLITGFEYGMLGVSLFGAAYGLNQIGKIAIVDLGQETFIWFIYVALLMQKRDGFSRPAGLIKMFATSPVIIGILAGLGLNMLGIRDVITTLPLINGLLNTIDLIGSLTIPLILIVVGYGIHIDLNEMVYSARVIFIRLAINIPTALLLNRFVVSGLMGLDKGFEAALFTLLILPPPFILTLFMKQDDKRELHSVDNTLMLHTLVSIVVFIVYYAFNPVI